VLKKKKAGKYGYLTFYKSPANGALLKFKSYSGTLNTVFLPLGAQLSTVLTSNLPNSLLAYNSYSQKQFNEKTAILT